MENCPSISVKYPFKKAVISHNFAMSIMTKNLKIIKNDNI